MKNGFTLVELLVVIGIIGMLGFIVLYGLQKKENKKYDSCIQKCEQYKK